MNTMFETYNELSNKANEAETNRRKYVAKIVETLQKKTDNGYIEFTDETSYPIFYDETTDENEDIVGAKSVDGVLYLTTDSRFKSLSWFNWTIYGKMDLDEFVFILENNFA